MGPITYFIAILGCSDGASACQTVASLAPRYESQAQCIASRDAALDANSDLDFPTLVAECRPASARSSGNGEPKPKTPTKAA